MIKTNTITLKEKLIFAFACVIALSVFMATLHLKDIVRLNALADLTTTAKYHDISEKAAQDLHNHVNKQMVKAFINSPGDGVIMGRTRDDIEATIESGTSLFTLVHEQLQLWRVYLSLPFSRVLA